MINGVNGVSTIHVLPPKDIERFNYAVNVGGKEHMADVTKLPSGDVIIRLDDGKKVETIITDNEGLIEFNKKHMPPQVIYNEKHDAKLEEEKVDQSLYGKIMRNLVLASMMMTNRRNNLTQMNISNMNQQMLEQQQMLTNMMMHQQAMQDHMTTVQMTTPGMGII